MHRPGIHSAAARSTNRHIRRRGRSGRRAGTAIALTAGLIFSTLAVAQANEPIDDESASAQVVPAAEPTPTSEPTPTPEPESTPEPEPTPEPTEPEVTADAEPTAEPEAEPTEPAPAAVGPAEDASPTTPEAPKAAKKAAAIAAAAVGVVDGIEYSYDDAAPGDGAVATDYSGASLSVVVPDSVTIDGASYDVIGIAKNAFKAKDLTSVVIGDNVRVIEDSAFDNNSIASLELGSSVVSIGSQAFYAASIVSLTIPDSVVEIGPNAFEGALLTDLDLGSSVEVIGDYAFGPRIDSAGTLGDVVVPDSVTSIGKRAFADQPLISVELGSGLETIGEYAFAEGLLTHLTIPDGVRIIGAGAFYFNRLTNMTFGDGPLSIGRHAFNFNQLTDVTFGAGPVSIGDYAFYANTFTSITLSAGVTHVGAEAFGDSSFPTSLETVRILGPGPTLAEGRINPNEPEDIWHGSFGHGEDVRIVPECEFAPNFGFTWNDYTVQTPAVSFDLGGHGATIDEQPVVCGTQAVEPVTPTESGWVFEGWRVGSSSGAAFTFSTSVTADLELHAGWRSATAPPASTITVATDRPAYEPGQAIVVSGTSDLPEGTAVEIVLRSDPVTLGSATVGGGGTYSLSALVPAAASIGDHSVTASATVDGNLVTATAAIKVVAAAAPTPTPTPAPAPGGDGTDEGDTDEGAGDAKDDDDAESDPVSERTAVLPATGAPASLQGLALMGLICLAAGLVLVRQRRRPAPTGT